MCTLSLLIALKSALLSQRNLDHESTHHVVQLEILLGAARVRVVAADTGLADGTVGVDGLEVGLIADFDHASRRPLRMLTDSVEADLF